MPLPGLSNLTGHGHRRSSIKTGSRDEGRPSTAGDATDDETIVEPDQGNVLSHIISQLRPGADLGRVTLPTFILEPRSMLERITNFMAHPEGLIPIPDVQDPVERFVDVVKFYMSGWHIRPPGVKKPLNPILGETFTGYWDYKDGTRGYYISEQTCHHPPKSSYYFAVPEHNIRVDGTLKPRSKFLGNSVGSFMEGVAILHLTNWTAKTPSGERYFLTQPNMYARGILFGKMKYELGDHSSVTCPENNLAADIEFKTKGWVGGTYNAISGVIKNTKTGETLYELSGMWSGEMTIKNHATGKKDILFDATHAKHSPPLSRPLEEQDERESQRLWKKTTDAIKVVNHTLATDEKTAIEEQQRLEASQRQERGEEWHPKLFRAVRGGHGGPEEGMENLDWIMIAPIDGKSPQEKVKQILAVAPILPGQKPEASSSQQHQPAPSAQQPQQPQHHQQPQTIQHSQQLQTRQESSQQPAILQQSQQPIAQQHEPVQAPQYQLPIRSAAETSQSHITSSHSTLPQGYSHTAHSELQIPQAQPQRPITPPIYRHDSATNVVDEFVDAEEK